MQPKFSGCARGKSQRDALADAKKFSQKNIDYLGGRNQAKFFYEAKHLWHKQNKRKTVAGSTPVRAASINGLNVNELRWSLWSLKSFS